MAGEQFSLVWNSFPTNLSSGLYSLLTDEHLVDVTLAAEGKILRAHKLILSVCSTYFRDLFKGNTCKHPIVILKDVNYNDLLAMLQFMYQGEVNIKQEDISSFLKVAETLQIKGLTRETNQNKNKQDELSTTVRLDDKIKFEKECNNDEEDVDVDVDDDELLIKNKEIKNINIQDDNKLLKDYNDNDDVDEDDVESTSSSITFNNENDFDNKINTQILSKINNDDDNNMDIENLKMTKNQISNLTINNNQDNNDDYDKPLDYRFVMKQQSTSNLNNNENNQIQSTEENTSYHSDNHEEPSDINQSQNCVDNLECFSSRTSKGRRTVKGISHSTLPLETTLRVVSELGPTLRVDRGKVVRMYSCPWCLRQFTRKENLKLHVKYLHGPLESLTCKLCGNKYKNSNSLRVHSYLYHNTKRNKHNNSLVASLT